MLSTGDIQIYEPLSTDLKMWGGYRIQLGILGVKMLGF